MVNANLKRVKINLGEKKGVKEKRPKTVHRSQKKKQTIRTHDVFV